MNKRKITKYISIVLAVGILTAVPFTLNNPFGKSKEKKVLECSKLSAEDSQELEKWREFVLNSVDRDMRKFATDTSVGEMLDINLKNELIANSASYLDQFVIKINNTDNTLIQKAMAEKFLSNFQGVLLDTIKTKLFTMVKEKKISWAELFKISINTCEENKIVKRFADYPSDNPFKSSDEGFDFGINYKLNSKDSEGSSLNAVGKITYRFKVIPVSITYNQPLIKDASF